MLKFGLVAGMLFILFAPTVGGLFETIRVKNDEDQNISDDSAVSFHDVAAYEISIKRGQKFIIKFSVYTVNVSASLKIVGKGLFDSEYQKNATNAPQTVTGKYFLVSKPAWGYDPSVSEDTQTVVTCIQDDFYYLEFMGDGQSSNDLIWNEPGDYVIFVYGSNLFVNSTSGVTFNLEILKSGPSNVITDIFYLLGLGVILIAGLVIGMRMLNKWRGA